MRAFMMRFTASCLIVLLYLPAYSAPVVRLFAPKTTVSARTYSKNQTNPNLVLSQASLLSVLLFPKMVFASSNSPCFRLNPLLACSQSE